MRGASGASDARIREMFAQGTLANVMVAIGAAEVDAPWTHTLLGDTSRA
ncbi:hypothetical protein LXT21_31140 [Myxococcus sp. K38C18041901]|nr:hypothetical protein [Myxococcus guangdongensis]MCP3063242.1 hypothetical protein [Myxococcus guangdongensis]